MEYSMRLCKSKKVVIPEVVPDEEEPEKPKRKLCQKLCKKKRKNTSPRASRRPHANILNRYQLAILLRD